MDSNEVMHWGIQGQKWGKRRWQNPDGSLTEEGRERYYGSKRRRKVRRAKDLSEDELRQAINRLNLEKTYYDSVVNEYKGSRAVEQVQHPLKSLGKYAIDDLSNEILRPGLIEAGKSTIKDIFRGLTKESFDTRKAEREKLEKELAKREEEAEKAKKEAAEALKITPTKLDMLSEVSDAQLAAALDRIKNESLYLDKLEEYQNKLEKLQRLREELRDDYLN